jgi:hypothetical protein
VADAAIVDELAAAILIVACSCQSTLLHLASRFLSRLLSPDRIVPDRIVSVFASTAALPRI